MKLSLVSFFIFGLVLYSNAFPQEKTAQKKTQPGGLQSADVNDPKVKKYATASLATLATESGSSGKVNLVEIIKAETQVVSGVKYHLTLKISDPEGVSKICHVEVWVQPWISEEPQEISNAYCDNKQKVL